MPKKDRRLVIVDKGMTDEKEEHCVWNVGRNHHHFSHHQTVRGNKWQREQGKLTVFICRTDDAGESDQDDDDEDEHKDMYLHTGVLSERQRRTRRPQEKT